MSGTNICYLVTFREITKDYPTGEEKGVAIFKTLPDACEWAEMKNACSENQKYTVYGVKDFIKERWLTDGTERN